jgi:hypothetical protein
MYEMGGLAPTSPHQARPVAWLCCRAAPPAGARHPCAGPVSRLLPRSQGRPQVVPVSSGESISTASANATQEPEANYFRFFRYPHGIHKGSQLSAPVGGYPPVYSHSVHKLSGVAQGIPAPTVAARNRLILPSLFRVITHMATRELWFRHLQYPWHYDSHIWRCSAYPAGLPSSPRPSSAWLGERRHAGGR